MQKLNSNISFPLPISIVIYQGHFMNIEIITVLAKLLTTQFTDRNKELINQQYLAIVP